MDQLCKHLKLLILLLPIISSAEALPEKYIAGTHYVELKNPVRTHNANKIEVMEVFWYGCPHCYDFEPLIDSWQSRTANDVDFRRTPGVWTGAVEMELHSQAYYTAVSLGVLDKLHSAIFTAYHQQNNRLNSEQALAELFAKYGVDDTKFTKAFNSFTVKSNVQKAKKRQRGYEIRSVPNLIVNGKYRVSSNSAVKTQSDMLSVVNFLVDKERAKRNPS